MPWSAHDGGEDGPGSIVSGEAGLAHTGPIVHNEGSNIVVTHVDKLVTAQTNKYSKVKICQLFTIRETLTHGLARH